MVPVSGSAYTYAYASLGRAGGLDHRLGPDHRVRGGQHRRGDRLVGLFPRAAEPLRHPASGLAGHRLSVRRTWRRQRRGRRRHRRRRACTSPRPSPRAPHLFGFPVIANLPAFMVVARDHRGPGDRHPGSRPTPTTRWCCSRSGSSCSSSRSAIILIRPANWNNPRTGGFAPNGFAGISAGAAIIFFSYIGFDAVSTAAEEAKEPGEGHAVRHHHEPGRSRAPGADRELEAVRTDSRDGDRGDGERGHGNHDELAGASRRAGPRRPSQAEASSCRRSPAGPRDRRNEVVGAD